jgi:hypothetical protein
VHTDDRDLARSGQLFRLVRGLNPLPPSTGWPFTRTKPARYTGVAHSPRRARCLSALAGGASPCPLLPPNALQLASHSVLRSGRGSVWRRTLALRRCS